LSTSLVGAFCWQTPSVTLYPLDFARFPGIKYG
jgi:hypothetical protein